MKRVVSFFVWLWAWLKSWFKPKAVKKVEPIDLGDVIGPVISKDQVDEAKIDEGIQLVWKELEKIKLSQELRGHDSHQLEKDGEEKGEQSDAGAKEKAQHDFQEDFHSSPSLVDIDEDRGDGSEQDKEREDKNKGFLFEAIPSFFAKSAGFGGVIRDSDADVKSTVYFGGVKPRISSQILGPLDE